MSRGLILLSAPEGILSNVITQQMVNGALNEVISLLPICLPSMITFIAIRKGISFVQQILRAA